CTSIEHGALVDQATLDLMAGHGMYFDPNIDLIFRNYFENKARYLGTPGYTEEGFAAMEKAVPRVLDIFKKALRTPRLKIVFGTDAVAGAHGRNFQELEYRVRAGGQDPMSAITSASSLAARSLGLGDRIGTLAPGLRRRPDRRRRRSARGHRRTGARGVRDERREGGAMRTAT